MRLSARTVVKVSIVAAVAVGAVTLFAHGSGAVSHPAPSLRTTVLKHQKLIAECMHRRGFDYIASVPSDVAAEESGQSAAQHGRDARAATIAAARGAPADPNDALVGKLPPPQQQAWGDALFGTDDAPGCYDQTYKAAWGVDLAEVAARGEKLVTRVKADPAVQAAQHAYADCMAGHGYHVTTTDDVYQLVGQQSEHLDAEAAAALQDAANSAHTSCMAPYNTVYNTVYRRLSTTQH